MEAFASQINGHTSVSVHSIVLVVNLSDLYNEENNALLLQADQYRTEITTLNKSLAGDTTLVNAALDLLRFTDKGVMLDAFDDELFEKTVAHIRILSRREAAFELKCGLTLKERM